MTAKNFFFLFKNVFECPPRETNVHWSLFPLIIELLGACVLQWNLDAIPTDAALILEDTVPTDKDAKTKFCF